MPIRLIDPSRPIKWVHPNDRDSLGRPRAGVTVFNVVGLTEGKARELRLRFIVGPDVKMPDLIGFKSELFAACVKSIENVQLPGEAVPRTLSKPEDIQKFIDCLPAEFAGDIYEAIQNIAELDAGTLKNSDESPA